MYKRILVTGSSGFIGNYLCTYLEAEGYSVCGLDNRPSFRIGKQYNFVLCDVLDFKKLTQVVQEYQPEVIVHLAARTDLNEKKSLHGYATNIKGTENLIKVAEASQSVKRILFTSSQLVCDVKYSPKSEIDYRPTNLYGKSKMMSEKIVRNSSLMGITWCILRPTTIWGEGMSCHYQNFLRLVQKGRFFHIGNAPLYKSYGYVGNAVYQYRRFIEASDQQINHKTFYIADYEPLSLRTWIDCLSSELGNRDLQTLPISLAKLLAHFGDVLNVVGFKKFPFNSFRLKNILTEYIFDLSETEEVCGSLPFSMEEGVQRTAEWFRNIH